MTVMNTEDVLIRLRELKPEITARFKAKEIGLFGSFVRGEQSGRSDIDVLVEFEEADLFDLVGMALFLEERLQRKVDVVPKRALRPELQEPVLGEVIAVWETTDST
jgi:predicted nucleotidyltransferase